MAIVVEPVVSHGENRPSERVEMRYRRRVGVNSCLGSCRLLGCAQAAAAALCKPCRQIAAIRQALKQIADVRITSWISLSDSVVRVPVLLPPGIEDHFLVRVIRIQSGDDTVNGVITNDGADTDLVGKFECVRCREKWLVLPDRLALVVEDGPTATDPARREVWSSFH